MREWLSAFPCLLIPINLFPFPFPLSYFCYSHSLRFPFPSSLTVTIGFISTHSAYIKTVDVRQSVIKCITSLTVTSTTHKYDHGLSQLLQDDSCTGSTFQTEYSTRSQSRFSNVCRTEHRHTSSTAAFRSPTSPLVNIYITWLCRATDEAHSVAWPSLLGADDLERTARRPPWPVAQCSNECCCMKSRHINLLLILALTLTVLYLSICMDIAIFSICRSL